MGSSPLISVIMTVYNRQDYVAAAIQSILDQTIDCHEIIVVDDGSTDRSREIIASFGCMVRSLWQENSGYGAATNRGLTEVRGDLVAFLDSDDLWMPDKSRLQLQVLQEHPEVRAYAH